MFNPQEFMRREALLDAPCDYDPETGRGCHGRRVAVTLTAPGAPAPLHVPLPMTLDPDYPAATTDLLRFNRLRLRHDFEFWAWRCVKIKDKLSGRIIPLRLNKPQRKVLDVLETQRLQDKPLRIIILKARQWGGSTMVQTYMAWIQSTLKENWHSLICSHLKDSAKSILGMYSMIIENYPKDLWISAEGDTPPAFRPWERSQNIRTITGRGCRVTVQSAESQEALRGADIAMAHLSETAFWPQTTLKDPADFMRSVGGSVALEPLTLIAMESTANGTANFFHDEWIRATRGQSDKVPVFVPWYEIDIYRMPFRGTPGERTRQAAAFWLQMTPYERDLWHATSLALSQIRWFHHKAKEYPTLHQMHAEFPTTPREAFVNTGAGVFSAHHIDTLRKGCRPPLLEGDIDPATGAVCPDLTTRPLQVWQHPQPTEQYLVTVDVGGRSASADYSVIAVFIPRPTLTLVAQWRGHTDHDLLGQRAVALARRYNNARLVIESNTLESAPETSSSAGVLHNVARQYRNVYRRRVTDPTGSTPTFRIGLHTNRATKAMMIDLLISAVRQGYNERDSRCCDELASYTALPNGSYAALPGRHDDILMTRAFALLVTSLSPAPPPCPRPLRRPRPGF